MAGFYSIVVIMFASHVKGLWLESRQKHGLYCQGCGSVVECVLCMTKVTGSIPCISIGTSVAQLVEYLSMNQMVDANIYI